MKKIYLFLAMLFGMFGSTAMFAQDDFILFTPDGQYGLDENQPLITEVDQFSSPMSDAGEGSFYALLGEAAPDGYNQQDFWHSNWHDGDQPAGTHYFQVDISSTYDPSMGLVAFWFTRRGASNDHTTQWSVRGTNNPDASKEACEELLLQDTPFTSNTESLTSNAFDTKGYQYIRFYSEHQYPSDRGYFHLTRFQIYPAVKLGDKAIILNMMNDAYAKYDAQAIQYPAGTTPGRYPADLVAALRTAIEKLNADEAEIPSTVEAVEALIQDCEDALEALQAARITEFSLPTGYYRILTGMEYNDAEPRYMCGWLTDDGKKWGIWSPADLENPVDAAQTLWKIENKGDGTYDIVSCYHDGRFMDVARSASVEMEDNSGNLMAFDLVCTDDDGNTFVNIRVATQDPDDYFYLHQGGHSNGNGTSGYLVGWSHTWSWTNADNGIGGIERTGCGASEWMFEPVDDSDAQQIIDDFAPYKDKNKWLGEFHNMLAEAKPLLEAAKDLVETTHPLITSADQLANYCGDAAEGTHIEYLIDGSGDTFWHTDWHGNFTTEDHHYLQVELTEEVATVAFQITRRNTTSGNQIDRWTVYGTNDDDETLTQADLEWLADIETPYEAGNNTSQHMSAAFPTGGFKYLRFYCAGTRGNDGSEAQDKFFHIAEFQLYPASEEPSPTSQYAKMGDVATTLEALIEDYEYADDEELEYSDYEKLKSAYDAFMNYFVDPTALRQMIAAATTKSKSVVAGTAPGFWSSDVAGAFTDLVSQASAYNEAGTYQQNEVDQLISKLEDAIATIDENIIPVQEGKWYRIRYGKEEEYAQYGWPTDGNGTDYWNNDEHTNDDEYMYNEAIFGKYMIPATWEDVVLGFNDSGDEVNGHRVIPVAKEDIVVNMYVFADADEDIEDKDLSMWRFIKVGDGYAIQNKATGLFMQNDGDIRATLSPTIFTQLAAGYGQNAFISHKIESGEQGSPLHLARNYNILCTWGSLQDDGVWQGMGGKDGRRACFFIEEVGDVASDFTSADCKMNFVPGDIYGRCFPVSVTVKDPEQGELWTVTDLECSDETVKVTLAKITDPKVPAGRPFFYIAAGDFVSDADAVPSDFSFTFDIITKPQTDGYLKGVFDSKTMSERFITAGSGHDEDALKFYDSGATLGNNRVYITPDGDSFSYSAELVFEFDPDAEDGIESALQNIARTGDIYTVDGRLVGKGNLNSLKQKGIYILNGTKVIVK